MDVSIYRLRHRDILTVCVLALLGLGIVMVQSASMKVTGDPAWTDYTIRLKARKLGGDEGFLVLYHAVFRPSQSRI